MKKIILFGLVVIIATIFLTSLYPNTYIEGNALNWREMVKLLKEKFNCITLVCYPQYQPLNKTEVKKFLENDKTNEHEYNKWKWNCMDFSRTLLVNITRKWKNAAVGIIIQDIINFHFMQSISLWMNIKWSTVSNR